MLLYFDNRSNVKFVLDCGPQAPAGFFLFPRLNTIMKGARFADVAAIQERVTAVLQSIPKEAFADSFQKLYERCQQCVVKDRHISRSQIATHHVTRHNTPIHNILSTAPQFSFSQKALGTLPEDGNIMPKHVVATIHN
jgi:hypothetical protein